MIKIRNATKRDQDFVFDGISGIIDIEGGPHERALAYLPKIKRAIGKGWIKVAASGSRPVGFAWYRVSRKYFMGVDFVPAEEKYLWISWIYVAPAHRKKGIATSLYRHLEDVAKEKGAKRMLCDVETGNRQSHDYHRKGGFREIYSIYSKKVAPQ